MNGSQPRLLRFSASGVRGIVGQTLTPELVTDLACAFGTFIQSGTVVVGRDPRRSGEMVKASVVAGLLSTGRRIVDLGICPIPIIQFMVRELSASGGIAITAGHNDARWNALGFINSTGAHLDPYQGEEVLDIYHSGEFTKQPWNSLGTVEHKDDYLSAYLDRLDGFLDVDAIRASKFKVIIDPCNGAAAGIVDLFCERLGCQLIPINNEPTGIFPHDPEPRPRNASQIASIIKPVQADIGFLLSSDAARLSVVTDLGQAVSEEYTFPLVLEHYLTRTKGPVVTNFSTTKTVDDIVRGYGCPLIKSQVGQVYSLHTALTEDAVIAGEGCGTVAVPQFHPGFDAFLAMGLVLEMMTVRNKKVSELLNELPRYYIVKEKVYCPPESVHKVMHEVRHHYVTLKPDLTDGVRVDWDSGWIHVRASTTEPMIRVIAENREQRSARQRADDAISVISQVI
jgi:phosphomannomutase